MAENGDQVIALDQFGFGVAVSRSAGSDFCAVRVGGDLDVATSPRLLRVLSELIAAGALALEIDLSELAFIDSTGLRVLVRAKQRVRSIGGELRLANPSPSVGRVLQITGLASALPLASVDG